MMDASDIDISRGVNRVSEDEELHAKLSPRLACVELCVPHANEVLHHKLENGLCRMCHVDFPLPVFEISLHRTGHKSHSRNEELKALPFPLYMLMKLHGQDEN